MNNDFLELVRKAEAGDADAQCKVGEMYDLGKDVELNVVEAKKWLFKSAEQGNAQAQVYVGNIYYRPHAAANYGIQHDSSKGLQWYEKAAAQGHTEAMNELGAAYYHGKVVAKDYTEAVKWWTIAAKKGHRLAQQSMAYMYEKGYGGVAKDINEAKRWRRLSDAQGTPYINGLGNETMSMTVVITCIACGIAILAMPFLLGRETYSIVYLISAIFSFAIGFFFLSRLLTIKKFINDHATQTVRINNKYAVELPALLNPEYGLALDASLEYGNKAGFYTYIIDGDKSVDSLDAAAEKALIGKFGTKKEMKDYTNINVNGLKGITFNVSLVTSTQTHNGEVNNIITRYQFAFLEGKYNVYQIVSQTRGGAFDKLSFKMLKIVNSFIEL